MHIAPVETIIAQAARAPQPERIVAYFQCRPIALVLISVQGPRLERAAHLQGPDMLVWGDAWLRIPAYSPALWVGTFGADGALSWRAPTLGEALHLLVPHLQLPFDGAVRVLRYAARLDEEAAEARLRAQDLLADPPPDQVHVAIPGDRGTWIQGATLQRLRSIALTAQEEAGRLKGLAQDLRDLVALVAPEARP